MSEKVRVKILKGQKRFCVKEWSLEKAEIAAEKGKVKILDDVEPNQGRTLDVQTADLKGEDIKTPEDNPTCLGVTADGDPCSACPKDGSDYCRWHGPDEEGDS